MTEITSHYDVAIVGAGIIGVTLSHELVKAGLKVCVIEKRSAPAMETSYANGGLITPSMSDPWAAPGLPGKLASWIGKEDAPFLLRPKALPGLWRWGPAFLANCTSRKWETNTRNMLALSQYSQRHLNKIAADTGLQDCLIAKGGLRVFSDEASLAAAQSTAQFMRDAGVKNETISAETCLEIEPALAHSNTQYIGGIFYPDDQAGNCYDFCKRLSALNASLGVTNLFDTTVQSVENNAQVTLQTTRGAIHADKLVIATAFAPSLLSYRLPVPLYPVKGYSVTLTADNMSDAPQTPLIDDGRKVGVVRLGNKLRLVGTAEFTGKNKALNEKRIKALLDSARPIVPAIDNYTITERWTGFRAMSPDGSPVIGEAAPNTYLSLGYGHLGWTNACGGAAILKGLITGDSPQVDPAPYSPQRGILH